ncbi:response regulator transcription factor [Streptomyces sp. NPDC092296]|uniref:response regulator transcription factor n=1 Tax=Streptomyces sp. NPDC092296 TaxID=3366012 RepID=UPI003819560F
MTGRPGAHEIALAPREAQVIARYARGESQTQAAAGMGVSVHTVREYTRSAYERLGADSAAHAVALAIGLGLLPADVATNHTISEGDSRVR